MVIMGTICLGLVWGWLLVRRLRGAQWPAVAQMLLGLVGQSALIVALLKPYSLLWFGAGVAIGSFLAAMVFRSWERRSARAQNA